MTLGWVPAPHHRGPGRLRPGPACPPLCQLACPQHCLSDRPVLGPHSQLHFPRRLPTRLPGPWGRGGLGRHCCSLPHRAAPRAPLGEQLLWKAAVGLVPRRGRDGRGWGPLAWPWDQPLPHSGLCGTVSLPGSLSAAGPTARGCPQAPQTVQNMPPTHLDLRRPRLCVRVSSVDRAQASPPAPALGLRAV